MRLKNMLMFNSLLRYYMMTSLATGIGCCMQLARSQMDDPKIERLESILALIVLLGQFTLIFVLTRVVMKNKARLKEVTFRQKFGTLYTPCAIDRGYAPLLFITIFLGRRLLVAISLGLLLEQPLLQLVAAQILSTVVLFWHLKVWPMENTRQNVLYLMNEYMYIACATYALGFSSYNYDA